MDRDKYVSRIEAYLERQNPGVTPISDVVYVKILPYSPEKHDSILGMLRDGRSEVVEALEQPTNRESEEDLIVFRFKDRLGSSRWMLVYDNWELWEDPRITAVI